MFIYDELKLYSKKEFSSSYYLSLIWEVISSDLYFALGISKQLQLTIIVDYNILYIDASSDYNLILSRKHKIDFAHSLSLCEEFTIDMLININTENKMFSMTCDKVRYYYSKDTFDEGIVEIEANITSNFSQLEQLRQKLQHTLVKEIQFAICRNIFHLDIEDKDFFTSKTHADYESVFLYSKNNNLTFIQSIDKCIQENNVDKDSRHVLISLYELTREEKNE
jgi:hypothetical protein